MNAVSGWVQSYETLDKSSLVCHPYAQQQSDQHLVSLHNETQHRQQFAQYGCAFSTLSQGPSHLISSFSAASDLSTDTPYIEPALWQQLNVAATTTVGSSHLEVAMLMTAPSILIRESPSQHYEPRLGDSRTLTPDAGDTPAVCPLESITIQQEPKPHGATYFTCPASFPSPLSSYGHSSNAKTPLIPSMSVTDDHYQTSASATFSWPQFCNSSGIASPSVSTPSLSAPSIYATTPSPSPALDVSSIPLSYCSSSPPYSYLCNNSDNSTNPSARSDLSGSAAIDRDLYGPISSLECRKSQLIRQKSSLLPSPTPSPSHSPHLAEYTSALVKSPSSPRVCHICRKQYANNSTLRRHQKIHAYANSTIRALAMFRTASVLATRPTTTVHSRPPLLGPDLPIPSLNNGRRHGSDAHLTSASGTSHLRAMPSMMMTIPTGYNLRSDPDMKKPECVGCNKPFARRDTVILHIKNQKRKWDQLCSLLPTLYEAAGTSLGNHKDFESSSTNRTAVAKARLNSPWEQSTTRDPQSAIGPHKPQKQRRLHPHRVVEKLWHATYQKQMSHLGANRAGPTLQSKQGDAPLITTATLHDQEARVEKKKEMIAATSTSRGENVNSNSPEGGDEGWLDLEGSSQLDKLKWMMTVMEEPPCWKERKVRMFGAFGMLEQEVLESPCHE